MKNILTIGFVVLFFIMTGLVTADVTVNQVSTVKTMGQSVAKEGTIKIKGDKSIMESSGKDGATAMPGMQALDFTVITDLDQGVIYTIDPNNKVYRETTAEEMKAVNMPPSEPEGDTFTWEVSVDDLGEQNIAGYNAVGLRGIAVGTGIEDPGQKTRITYEIWAAKGVPGENEMMDHFKKMSELTGQDHLIKNELVNKMYSQVGPAFGELVDKLSKLEGFPVKMTMEAAITLAGDSQDSDKMIMMQQMMGAPDKDGWLTLTSFTNEVTGFNTDAVDDAIFKLPEGFKKQ